MERLKHIIHLNMLLGAWLFAAPFILSYASTPELANDIAVGCLLIACGWWMLNFETGQLGAGGCALLASAWLLAAPFVWHYNRQSPPFQNDVLVGILSLAVGLAVTWMTASRVRRLV